MVARARWLVMRPRTSLGETPALWQSIGITALLMYVLATRWARQANRRSAASPVLRSVMGGCAGRTASHASMARPSKGSTGLVNAAPVLWTGTSSRQTGAVSVPATSPGCQRTQPTRKRTISSLRWPANNQVSASADEFEGIGADTTDGEVIGPEIEPGP